MQEFAVSDSIEAKVFELKIADFLKRSHAIVLRIKEDWIKTYSIVQVLDLVPRDTQLRVVILLFFVPLIVAFYLARPRARLLRHSLRHDHPHCV